MKDLKGISILISVILSSYRFFLLFWSLSCKSIDIIFSRHDLLKYQRVYSHTYMLSTIANPFVYYRRYRTVFLSQFRFIRTRRLSFKHRVFLGVDSFFVIGIYKNSMMYKRSKDLLLRIELYVWFVWLLDFSKRIVDDKFQSGKR